MRVKEGCEGEGRGMRQKGEGVKGKRGRCEGEGRVCEGEGGGVRGREGVRVKGEA